MNEHSIRESVEALIESSESTSSTERTHCCLCREDCSSSLQLRNHLGYHQRQLALFALPSLDSEDYDSDDDADAETNGSSVDHNSVTNEGRNEDVVDPSADRDQCQKVSLFSSIHQQQAVLTRTQAQDQQRRPLAENLGYAGVGERLDEGTHYHSNSSVSTPPIPQEVVGGEVYETSAHPSHEMGHSPSFAARTDGLSTQGEPTGYSTHSHGRGSQWDSDEEAK